MSEIEHIKVEKLSYNQILEIKRNGLAEDISVFIETEQTKSKKLDSSDCIIGLVGFGGSPDSFVGVGYRNS